MPSFIDTLPPIGVPEYLGRRRKCGVSVGDRFGGTALTLRGRDAVALAVHHFKLGTQDTILMPGYVCDSVTAGIGNACSTCFYDAEPDLIVRPDRVAEQLDKVRPRVFVLIHYFGFLQPHTREIADICHGRGVQLWEDHAHSAAARFERDWADAMIFSFRKLFYTPDGGGLWVRDIQDKPAVQGSTTKAGLYSAMVLVRRMVWGHLRGLREVIARRIQARINSQNQGRGGIQPRPISPMSRRALHSVDLDREFSARRQLYSRWTELLDGGSVQALCPKLGPADAPSGYPVWLANPDEIVRRLEPMSVFLKIHWRNLPAEAEQSCPTARLISYHTVTLPVYRGLPAAAMKRIAQVLNQYGRPFDRSAIGG